MSDLLQQAAILFNVPASKVPTVLRLLGLCDVCSKCRGNGLYSYQTGRMGSCSKCDGKGKIARTLTPEVFAMAKAKVAAGELNKIREEQAAKGLLKKVDGRYVRA